jgi:hypothetical protein
VRTTAATIGPKAPKNTAGTGSEGIRPRDSSAAAHQKDQVNAKARTKYPSGKALFVADVAARDGVAAVIAI